MSVSEGLVATVDVAVGDFRLHVDLAVGPGQTVAVVGPNGAGKSTLLRALAGLLPIDEGTIRLDGVVLDDTTTGGFTPVEERSIGVVFQDYLLFPHLSAIDNVAFGLRSRGMASSAAREVARTWLDRVGLASHMTAKPRQLSGGQAQRVALARALVGQPRLVLLDEPLSSLDSELRAILRTELARIQGDLGVTMVYVTHDRDDAAALADSVVEMRAGRIVSVTAMKRKAERA